jgi:hypothetical protein
MNELSDILNAALVAPQVLSFSDEDEAKSWQFRAYKYRNRHPEFQQLMLTRRGREVKVRVPQFTIQGE